MHKESGNEAGSIPSLVVPPDRTAALYRLTDRLYRARSMADVYDAALDAIIETMDCRRASVLLFDADGVMRFVTWRDLSERYRSVLEGHTPWRPGQPEPDPIFVSDIDLTDESQKVKDTIKAEGIRALGFVPLLVDGGVVGKFMTYYEDVRSFTEEERNLAVTVARHIAFSLERHRADAARETAEQELKHSEERFRTISELAPAMMWLSDEHGRCLHLNRMLREFWGVTLEAMDGFDWRDSMHPDDAGEIGQRMYKAMSERAPVQVKGRYRNAKGEFRVLQTSATPRFADDGSFRGMVGVNTDITERERAEAERDLLLAEFNHRVKNTIAVVQGLANQTFKPDVPFAEAKRKFDGRLMALSRAHDQLVHGSDEYVSLGSLAEQVLGGRGMDQRSRIDGPSVVLASRQSMAIAMVFHELFTNAVKYGAFSNDHGMIALTWQVANDEVRIVWREQGGPPVQPPSRLGFGSRLLERGLADVGGSAKMEFAPDGVICTITTPLPAGPAGEAPASSLPASGT